MSRGEGETEGPQARGLHGVEVCVTGRLWTMDHREARQKLRAAGGRWTALPGRATRYVVVGDAAPPLGADGRVPRALTVAGQLRRAGADLHLLRETEFLTLLGMEDRRADLERLYTLDQLSRILAVPAQDVRRWMRVGLVHPVKQLAGGPMFSFPQVAAVRDLWRLVQAGISPQILRRNLQRIRSWLPEGELALGQLEVIARNRVALRLSDGRLVEPSGQLHLAFGDGETPVGQTATSPGRTLQRDWFSAGVAAEEKGDLAAAIHAYRQASLSGGPQPETAFNLGNCYYAQDCLEDAVASYGQAVHFSSDYVEAWNNLGNALCDLHRTDEAVQAYRRAIATAPDYADAHYNLAETLAAVGDLAGARRHWRAYLEHDPSSSWARRVRQRLRELGED